MVRKVAKPEPQALMTYGEADPLRSGSWAVLPLDPKTRRPYGAYAVFQPSVNASNNRGDFIAILCACPPGRGIGAPVPDAPSTYVAALDCHVRDKRSRADIEEVIQASTKWLNGSRMQPRRVSSDGSFLLPFQSREPFSGPKTLRYRMPNDRQYDPPQGAEVLSGPGDFFIVSGPGPGDVSYTWPDVLPSEVHRDALPLLDQQSASALVNEIDRILTRRGGKAL